MSDAMDEEPSARDVVDEEPSARDVEREIEEMKWERSQTEKNLRRIEVTQRRFQGEERKAASVPLALVPSEDPRKRRRSLSAKGSDDEDDREAREKRRKANGLGVKPDARSRMMFKGLVGHLQSAKQRLDTEKDWKSTELNAQAQQRLEEKLQRDKQHVIELKKRQFDTQKQEEESKAALIDKRIEEKELLLLRKRLEGHYALMMNFIRTKAEPTIFYLPAKHNKTTEKMLEETRAAIKHKIEHLKVQLQPVDAETAADASAASALANEAPAEVAAKAPVEEAAKAESCAQDSKLPESEDGGERQRSSPKKERDLSKQLSNENGASANGLATEGHAGKVADREEKEVLRPNAEESRAGKRKESRKEGDKCSSSSSDSESKG